MSALTPCNKKRLLPAGQSFFVTVDGWWLMVDGGSRVFDLDLILNLKTVF